MQKIKVFRFQYFDRGTKQFKESDDFATEKAIVEMGAIVLHHATKEVEERVIGRAGIVFSESGSGSASHA